MSTLSVSRKDSRAIWPTEEEASTILRFPKDMPIISQNLLTVNDDIAWEEEKKFKKAKASNNSELAKIVEARDIELLRAALTTEKELPTRTDLNEAFLLACQKPVDLDAVRLLLQSGADVNSVMESGDAALHIACYARNEDLAKVLIGAGIDVNSRDRLGWTPLHVTAIGDFPSGATLLLQSGADIEAKDDSARTPLYQSCGNNSVNTQRVLMLGDAEIDCLDNEGWTPLHEAACEGHIDSAATLLAANARIDIVSDPEGLTPLHVAVLYDKKDMVRYLLDAGLNPYDRTSAGFASLQLAVLAESHPVVDELLQWSTEFMNQKSVDGSTALHIAAGRGSAKMVDLLLTYGADTTLGDGDGLTPSDVAAEFGNHSIATMFDRERRDTSRSLQLCSTCEEAGILSLLEKDRSFQKVPLGTYESVRQRMDCPFCSMVLNTLPTDASKYVNDDGTPPEVAVLRTGVAVPRLEVQFWDILTHGYVQVDDEFDSAEEVGSISLEDKYVAVNDVDYALIRSWINECEEVHDATPLTAFNSASQRTVHDILLIDVERQCVVSGTVEQRYVALSYVWGRIPGFQTTKQTESRSKTQGFLRTVNLPRVIGDAINFVENLGERYIWIDALCIVQDDSVHKQSQLAQMDMIYSRALVTLVALSVFDAESGLAGLTKESRASARSVQYINGQRLISKPPEFNHVFKRSKYSSRAWTLQESILSPRCLYVTNNQIYYSCHGTLRAEDGRDVSAQERKASRSVNWFTDALFEAQQQLSPDLVAEDWMHHFRTYAELVAECTSRNLSDPSDVLNATLGPLMVLSPYLGPFSLAGLPDLYLDHALLWAPNGGEPMTRNEHFPSWSWAGWNYRWACRCTYFVKPVFLGSTSDPIPLESAIGRFETFWQTAPRIVGPSDAQRRAADDHQAQPIHGENAVQSWSLKHIQDRAAAFQVLSFETEIVHRTRFDIREERPKLRMLIIPGPTVTLIDNDGIHCGVLYDEFDSLIAVQEVEDSGWILAFILLSRTEAPPLSQNFFFNAEVYERRPKCLLNIMLVKFLSDPLPGFTLRENKTEFGGPVTPKFERVAIGQIHSDAWEAARPLLCPITLF